MIDLFMNPFGQSFAFPDETLEDWYVANVLGVFAIEGEVSVETEELKEQFKIRDVIDCFAWLEDRL